MLVIQVFQEDRQIDRQTDRQRCVWGGVCVRTYSICDMHKQHSVLCICVYIQMCIYDRVCVYLKRQKCIYT